MIDWMTRAKHEFSQKPANPTAKTDETPLSSVSSAAPARIARKLVRVSSVSSVGGAAVPAKRILVMTKQQADACHAGGWSDAEIEAFISRCDRLLRWGWAELDAERLAERLVLRDREQDDRHACAECRYGRARTCPDGSPLPLGVLHRCGGFAP
ncbi:hypothetical protein [uncultured Piscinibacter sp.]|uniref:hypothetical protein n=1 Tax=uncultured Piscinibacter sp. TaxID=1131835 RepID=UPI002608A9C7|nr:hypothetical protein [uncultured Piscinibacter sp.]